MSKIWELDQETSNLIYLFFEGDINKINKSKIKEIYDNPKINKNFELINLKKKKELLDIIKKRDKNFRILLKANVDDIEPWNDKKTSDVKSKKIVKVKDVDDKYISFQRKAFINWINNTFYKKIIEINKNNDLKIYQNFVKEYLSIDTPYRGLLVYHGLGRGKTATAISTAEGLSNNMKITTLLPASLETNFINEVKKWGEDLFDINNQNWVFIDEEEYLSNTELRTKLYDRYDYTSESLINVYNSTLRKVKPEKIEKGVWILADTEILKNKKKKYDEYIEKLSEEDKEKKKEVDNIYIKNQINKIIKLKYNFIHYNPFPKVSTSSIKEFEIDSSNEIFKDTNISEEQKTDNAKIVKKLEDKLQYNIDNYNINSPFYNEVIIIDEVHNFVREILNNSGPSRIFYEWIMNGKNIKLICLSGTPIINVPCEIAILFNMIRGITKTYNFVINTSKNTLDILDKIKDIFYKNNTPINQINLFKKSGKLCISFMDNDTRFESIMDPDNNYIYTIKHNEHNFEDFVNNVFTGLEKLFDKDKIIPSKSDIDKLSDSELINIIRGKEIIFDDITNIIFNKYRPLFTLTYNDSEIDLSDNNNFMNYFFNDSNEIPSIKRTLLKRMILGLVSYSPIDRSSITIMPEVVIPNNIGYNDYNISKKIQIELCSMSLKQFNKYEGVWLSEKEKSIKMNRKKMYDKSNFDYHIRTRQACNMVYNNDNFRKDIRDKSEEDIRIEKNTEYESLTNSGSLIINEGLQEYSPKFNRILNNLSKFINDKGESTGKVLFYSEFRADAGSEIFEVILNANGYKKYIKDDDDKSPRLRYTFITGSEKEEERKNNLQAFNDSNNKYGEFIQIMIISGAGAEGISLECVRQVHILEPYWNFVRIDQVFGRAIRMGSHKTLEPDKRNVEQFLYISVFPGGETYEEIYDNFKKSEYLISVEKRKNIDKLELLAVDKVKEELNVTEEEAIKTDKFGTSVKELLSKHEKDIYDVINKIFRIKNETRNSTADQNLLDIMERKFVISQKISDIIKESSVDCLQNTRDDFKINQGCIQFDPKLLDENSYYPGISAENLNEIDEKQLLEDFSYFIEPDIYIVSGTETFNDIDNKVFLYIKLNKDNIKEDIRYIKDNGKIIGKFNINLGIYVKYIYENLDLDKEIGNKFSIFQEIYKIPETFLEDMKLDNPIFVKENKFINQNNLIGYKLKYNIDEKFYYLSKDSIIKRIYDYNIAEYNMFDMSDFKDQCIIIYNKNIYESIEK